MAKYVTIHLAEARKSFLEEFYARTKGELPDVPAEGGVESSTITVEASPASDDEPDFGDM